MRTKIIKLDENSIEEASIREAGQMIKKGGLVAFPTETVYGLGGDALNPESSRKIYAAKGRPSDNPLIIHIYRFEDIHKIVTHIPETAKKIAKAFWPGPLTMILPKSAGVPEETTGGLNTVAIRMPSHPIALKLIEYAGGFVAAPSANISGKPSPTLAKYVIEDMEGRIPMILDGGEVGIGLESTIIDLVADVPRILRPGSITQEMIAQVLGKVEMEALQENLLTEEMTGEQAPLAPGMKYRHYAPKGILTIVSGDSGQIVDYINHQVATDQEAGEKTGVIGSEEQLNRYQADVVKCVGSREDEQSIARRLYQILREFDEEGVSRIYSEAFSTEGMGQAIMNRLLKAAGYRVINLNEKEGSRNNDCNRK